MATLHVDVQLHQSDKELRRGMGRFTKGVVIPQGLCQKTNIQLSPSEEHEYPILNNIFIFQSNYFDTDVSPFDLFLVNDLGETLLSGVSISILDVKNIKSVRVLNTGATEQSYHVLF